MQLRLLLIHIKLRAHNTIFSGKKNIFIPFNIYQCNWVLFCKRGNYCDYLAYSSTKHSLLIFAHKDPFNYYQEFNLLNAYRRVLTKFRNDDCWWSQWMQKIEEIKWKENIKAVMHYIFVGATGFCWPLQYEWFGRAIQEYFSSIFFCSKTRHAGDKFSSNDHK